MIVATQIRTGMTIIHNGSPCKVIDVTHVTPGKGRGMVQSKLKDLVSGAFIEYRFRSDEKVERAILEQHEMEYLYNTDNEYHFMNTETYEQIALSKEQLGDYIYYLKPNVRFQVEFFDGRPVGIQPPLVVELEIKETQPHLKGATAASSMKPATLETGLVVSVPSYLEAGDVIRIDTRDGKFIERAR